MGAAETRLRATLAAAASQWNGADRRWTWPVPAVLRYARFAGVDLYPRDGSQLQLMTDARTVIGKGSIVIDGGVRVRYHGDFTFERPAPAPEPTPAELLRAHKLNTDGLARHAMALADQLYLAPLRRGLDVTIDGVTYTPETRWSCSHLVSPLGIVVDRRRVADIDDLVSRGWETVRVVGGAK